MRTFWFLLFVSVNCFSQTQFAEPTPYSFESFVVLELSSGDVNNDNLMDALSVNDDQEVHLHLRQLDGAFHDTLVYTPPMTAGSLPWTTAVLADMDNDGFLDILLGQRAISTIDLTSTGIISFYRNDGLGGFELPQVLTTTGVAGQFIVKDLNNDSYLDVFYSLDDEAYFMLSTGDNSFSDAVPIPADSFWAFNAYCFADIDADGMLNFVYPARFGEKEVFGLPNFSDLLNQTVEPTPMVVAEVTTTSNIGQIECGDINADGKLDFVLRPLFGPLLWLNDNGSGEYAQVELANLEGVQTFTIFDANGDGFLDIVYALSSGQIFWKQFLDAGTFSSPESIGISEGGLGFSAPIDFDFDGDLDLVLDAYIQVAYDYGGGTTEFQFIENMPNLPRASFIYNSCDGTYLDNTSTCYYPNSSFEWDFGNGQTSTLATPPYPYDESDTGVLELSLIVSNEVGSDTMIQEVTHHWIDFSIPNSGLVGEGIDFGFPSHGFSNFTWVFGDGEISSEQSPSHIYNEVGTYTVECIVTDSNVVDCTNSFSQEIVISDDIGLAEIESLFIFYPNPTASQITVRTEEPNVSWSVRVFDLAGTELLVEKSVGATIQLELERFVSGVYILQYRNENGVLEMRKLVRL